MWTINNLSYKIENKNLDKVAIDCLTQLGYDIPRFCYHENLKIAGNCRMCLIEDVKAPKPIICCAMSLTPNLNIFTNTLRVKKARESVMEFLLINHPLDCPICDQGGECDLQDLALVYGSDRGRFYEYKRNVEDKNCGFVIKTIMNRCILCTRCVRYSTDIINFSSFGITGRGSKMEIGSYIEKLMISELSGNLVDICPVGALTSKPYSFLARPWELKKISILNIFDDYIQNLRADIKENTLIRILPAKNNLNINQWITNRVRFSYEGLKRSRLLNLKVKQLDVSWNQFLQVFSVTLKNFLCFTKNNIIINSKLLLSDIYDLNTLVFSQLYSFLLGSSYVKTNIYLNTNILYPICDFNMLPINKDIVITIAKLILEWDAPILNTLLSTIVSSIKFINIWNSKINFKNIDIYFFKNSVDALSNYFKGKHWLNTIKNYNIFFYNYTLKSLFDIPQNIISYCISSTQVRLLNIISTVPTHSQNSYKITSLLNCSINNYYSKIQSIIDLSQDSHNNSNIFSIPTQSIFEQGNSLFYNYDFTKVYSSKSIITPTHIKSNFSVIKLLINLLGLKINKNIDSFDYTKNTPLQNILNLLNCYKITFSFKNYLYLISTKLTYSSDNVLSRNSVVTVSVLRSENMFNIYNI